MNNVSSIIKNIPNMKAIFIRHSKTVFEKDTPPVNWVLSEEGVKLAKDFAKKEAFSSLDVIYSSLQNKALETAVILAKPNRIPIDTCHELTEVTSITNGIIPDYEETVRKFHEGELENINNGETIQQALDRFSKALKRISSKFPNGTVGIVSHANILSIYLSRFCSYNSYQLHKKIQMPDYAIMDYSKKKLTKLFQAL
ncbi:hypothetical protein GF357_02505 [Candidatus Dojkabacteria bacterium]|nr:hypothetical protein [Candidatus Dojkabacteria bacterium]